MKWSDLRRSICVGFLRTCFLMLLDCPISMALSAVFSSRSSSSGVFPANIVFSITFQRQTFVADYLVDGHLFCQNFNKNLVVSRLNVAHGIKKPDLFLRKICRWSKSRPYFVHFQIKCHKFVENCKQMLGQTFKKNHQLRKELSKPTVPCTM